MSSVTLDNVTLADAMRRQGPKFAEQLDAFVRCPGGVLSS